MPSPSWSPDDARTPTLIEENWLFRLVRAPFRSRATGKSHDYYVVELADAVQVIALTPTHKVILVRQFRAGSGRDSLEPPGGLVGEGEDPLAAAARELIEETGYAGDPPILLGTAYSNPSILNSRIHTTLITNVRAVAPPSPDPDEELQIELVPAGQVPWMIRDGRIDHALAVQAMLLWLAADLPGSPFEPDHFAARRGQWHLRSLMLAVLVFAGVFSIISRLRPGESIALALATALAFGPFLTLRYLDPPSKAVLLRSRRLNVRYKLLRFLAVIGTALILFVASAFAATVIRI